MSGALIAVGAIAIVIGLLGGLGYIMMMMKGGRIAKTPFHKTGEVASKGEAVTGDKGSISTEGKLVTVPDDKLLVSPVEGKKCLWYSLTVTAQWKAGDNNVSVEMMKENKGLVFEIDDGSGAIKVDPGTGGDFEPQHKFNQTKGKGLKAAFTGGGIKFGATNFEVHPGGRYKGKMVPDNAKIKVVETVLEPQEMFYVNGKLEEGVIKKHNWSSLILSNKSRDETLAATQGTQKNAMYAGVGGGVLGPILLGIGMALAPADTGDDAGANEPAVEEAAPTDAAKPAEKPAEAKPAAKPAEKPAEKPAAKPAEKPAAGKAEPKAAPKAGGGARRGGKAGKRKR